MDRTQRARDILQTMLHTTRLTHRRFAQLTGRSERTVTLHANHGTIPESVAAWLDRVQEIRVVRTSDGITATIVLTLPYDRNQFSGHYEREKARI